MNLDEAIKHCEEKASSSYVHLQLAEWLKELKNRRNRTGYLFNDIDCALNHNGNYLLGEIDLINEYGLSFDNACDVIYNVGYYFQDKTKVLHTNDVVEKYSYILIKKLNIYKDMGYRISLYPYHYIYIGKENKDMLDLIAYTFHLEHDDIMLRYNIDTKMLTCEDDEREITQEELQALFDELKNIGAVK